MVISRWTFSFYLAVFLVGLTGPSLAAPECTSNECQRECDRLYSYIDEKIKPCDDFYRFSCGKFGSTYSKTHDSLLIRRNNDFLAEIEELWNTTQTSPLASVTKKLYDTCRAPLGKGNHSVVDFIRHVIKGWTLGNDFNVTKSWPELYLDTLVYGGVPVSFDIDVTPESQQKILLRKALFLNADIERSYGLVPRHEWLDHYARYIVKTAKHFGLSHSDEALARDAKMLAALEFDLVSARFDGNKHQSTSDDMVAHVFGFSQLILEPLTQMLNMSYSGSLGRLPVTLDNPSFWNLQKTFQTLNQANNGTLAAKFFGWKLMHRYAPLVSRTVFGYLNQFYRHLPGHPRADDCKSSLLKTMEMALFRQYVDRFMNSQKRTEVLALALQVRNSLQALIRSSKLINADMKSYFIQKIQSASVNIGYPNWITVDYLLNSFYGLNDRDTSVSLLDGRSHMEKLAIINRGKLRFRFLALGPSGLNYIYQQDQNWDVHLWNVNAYFFRQKNSFTVPATMLQLPFYGQDRPFVFNYAMTGSMFGGQFAHLLDLYYEQLLGLSSEDKMMCFDRELHDLETRTHVNIPGLAKLLKFPHRDLISDLIGLQSAYLAYKRHANHATTRGLTRYPNLESYTTDQLFFIGYAQSFCEAHRPQLWIHSQLDSAARLNFTLSNSKAFSRAFHCTRAPMNPSSKCSIWQ